MHFTLKQVVPESGIDSLFSVRLFYFQNQWILLPSKWIACLSISITLKTTDKRFPTQVLSDKALRFECCSNSFLCSSVEIFKCQLDWFGFWCHFGPYHSFKFPSCWLIELYMKPAGEECQGRCIVMSRIGLRCKCFSGERGERSIWVIIVYCITSVNWNHKGKKVTRFFLAFLKHCFVKTSARVHSV